MGVSGIERFACEAGGYVYAVMEETLSNVATMRFREPLVRTSWGALVEPAMENLLANPCDSSFEGCEETSWTAYGDSLIEVTSEAAHSGSSSLRISNPTGTSTIGADSPVVHGCWPAGTEVSAAIRVSGWTNVSRVYAKIIDKTNGLASPLTHVRTGVGWLEMTVNWRLPKDSTSLYLSVITWSASEGARFYVDSTTLVTDQMPATFHMGGHPRAAETLCHRVAFPDCWTDIFCWQPPYSPATPYAATKVIKSWCSDEQGSWLQLVLDEKGAFKLEDVRENSTDSLASMAAPEYLAGSLIRFAVVQGSDRTGLQVLCPQGWSRTDGRRTAINPTRVFFGSTPEGTMQAGGLYSNARVYDANMTDDQIVRAIDEIAEQGWTMGDLDNDGEVGFRDLAMLGESWLDPNGSRRGGCAACDLDLSGQVDMRDFAIIADNWQPGW